jgi:DNA repair protein SbcD/Mre11
MAPESAARRRALLRASLDRVVTLAAERRVDALCIAGDLFERENATIEAGQFLRGLFNRLSPTPVLVAPGNHDYYHAGCLYDRVSWTPNVHVFRSPDFAEIPVADGVVVGSAFTTESQTDWMRLPTVDADRPRVGLLHADLVSSATTSSAYRPLRREDVAAAGLMFALLGHQHSAMLDREARVAYTGSLEPLDRTEDGSRWVHILDVDATGVRSEQVSLAASSVVEVEVDVTGIVTAGELACRVGERSAGHRDDYLFLTLSGERSGELALDWTAALTSLGSGVASVVDRTNALGDWRRYLEERSVRGRFVRSLVLELEQVRDDSAQADLLMDELTVGLAALEGRQALPL